MNDDENFQENESLLPIILQETNLWFCIIVISKSKIFLKIVIYVKKYEKLSFFVSYLMYFIADILSI